MNTTSKEKQIEEMAKCENCIHAKVCVIRGFPSAFENTHWEKEPCDHYCKQSEPISCAHEKGCEWISVDERLPSESGKYLVATERGTIVISRFYTADGGLFSFRNLCNVTHWMPLPERPMMKGE